MPMRVLRIGLSIVAVFGADLLASAQQDPKVEPNEIARAVAGDFLDATARRNVDATMKVVDVPFCNDGREIIKERNALRDHFTRLFATAKVTSMAKVHVRFVETIAELQQSKRKPPVRKHSLEDTLVKTDLVVFAELERDGRFQPIWIGIRLEKGVGKVVGAID